MPFLIFGIPISFTSQVPSFSKYFSRLISSLKSCYHPWTPSPCFGNSFSFQVFPIYLNSLIVCMCSDSKNWFVSMSHGGEHWGYAKQPPVLGWRVSWTPSNFSWGVQWSWLPFCLLSSFILHSLFGHFFFLISLDFIKQFAGWSCVPHMQSVSKLCWFYYSWSLGSFSCFPPPLPFTLAQSTIISHLDYCYNVLICLWAFIIAVLAILHITARVLLKIIK